MRRALFLTLLVLSSCATPYAPAGARGGWEDGQDGDQLVVTFAGNSFLSRDQVATYARRRAAERCGGMAPVDVVETTRCRDLLSAAFSPTAPTCEQYAVRLTFRCPAADHPAPSGG